MIAEAHDAIGSGFVLATVCLAVVVLEAILLALRGRR